MFGKVSYLTLSSIALVLFVFMIKFIVDSPEAHQWDFKVYYAAARVQEDGMNPYDRKAISSIVGENSLDKYLYPPMALPFFRLFTSLDFNQALNAFLFLKAFLFLFTVLLWRKTFVERLGPLYYLFCLLAFKSVVFTDLRAGNVTIIELFLISTGLHFYLRKRYVWFSMLICAAGVFKLTPAVLLVLLLFTQTKNKYLYLVIFSSLFVAVQGLFFFLEPNSAQNFVAKVLASDERGFLNPALLPIMKDAAYLVHKRLGLTDFSALAYVLYGLAAMTILGVSAIALAKAPERRTNLLFVSMFVISIYLVVLPRVKDYTFLLAVFPVLYIVTQSTKRIGMLSLCFLFTVADNYLFPFLSGFMLDYFWPYYQYFLAFVAWLMYISAMSEARTDSSGFDRPTDGGHGQSQLRLYPQGESHSP